MHIPQLPTAPGNRAETRDKTSVTVYAGGWQWMDATQRFGIPRLEVTTSPIPPNHELQTCLKIMCTSLVLTVCVEVACTLFYKRACSRLGITGNRARNRLGYTGSTAWAKATQSHEIQPESLASKREQHHAANAYLLLIFQCAQAERQAWEPAVHLVVQVPGTQKGPQHTRARMTTKRYKR